MNTMKTIILFLITLFSAIYAAQNEQENQRQESAKQKITKCVLGAGSICAFGYSSVLASIRAAQLFLASKYFDVLELKNTVNNTSKTLGDVLFKDNVEVHNYINNVGSPLLEPWYPIGKALESEPNYIQEGVKSIGTVEVLFSRENTVSYFEFCIDQVKNFLSNDEITSFIKKISTSDIQDGQNNLVTLIKQNLAIRGSIVLGIAGISAMCTGLIARVLFGMKKANQKQTIGTETA